MRKPTIIPPHRNELPHCYADRLGLEYSANVSLQHKKTEGQFFTPIGIAELMGSFAKPVAGDIRILDPGCGVGILSTALIESLVQSNKVINSIELSAYETDRDLIPYTEAQFTYLKKWLKAKDIELKYAIQNEDFILSNIDKLQSNIPYKQNTDQRYDFVISNPPYFKLSKDDTRVKKTRGRITGQTNIYSLFMSMSAKLLNPTGQIIFIIPRSFTSGSYFKEFRESFFKIIRPERIHLFDSRRDTFGRDKILQETMILKGRVRKSLSAKAVTISSSHGLRDIDSPLIKTYEEGKLIDLSSQEKIFHLPTNDTEESIVDLFKSWNGNLKKYNIQISTGPVVAFRSWDFIHEQYSNGTLFLAPLFWLHNVQKMVLEWPNYRAGKGQYISIKKESKSILIPNKNYILLRRFSAKDDKSRLVAAPYFSNFIEAEFIGVENKVNYIYRPNGHLDRNEVVGLCALLNSELFDSYFRIFNGNVNVSATELREMTLPPLEIIKEIGDRIILTNDFSLENINDLIAEHFSLSEILSE